jgi:hypothetical protein
MTSKHTPGPWRISLVDETLIQGGGRDVAMACGDYDTDFERMEANARLIAAAPDLLAALIGLQYILASAESNASGNPNHDHVQQRVGAVRAAIAKARGG